jgi:UDP-N-acetylglucosamine acyltransferase
VTTEIDPRAVVDPTARLDPGCRLGPFCIVEAGASIGEGCELEPFSRVCRNSSLGPGVRVGQGAVVGGLAQVTGLVDGGNCQVGDRTRIGEYATIHASKHPGESTILESEVMLMAYAHVGHDCRIGNGAIVANAAQLGGHVELERGVFLGGGTLVHQFVRVGEFAFVAGGIRLDRDVAPWSRAMGEPPRWAGLNLVGMRRSPQAPDPTHASRSLRTLLRSGFPLEEAVEHLTDSGTPTDAMLIAFLERSRRGLLRPKG